MAPRSKPILRIIRLWASASLAGVAGCHAAEIVADPVEPRDGWQIITNGAFTAGTADVAAARGAAYFNGVNTHDEKSPATNRGAAKFFKGVVFTPGTYELSLSVGKAAGVDFVNNLSVLLLADTGKTGDYEWGGRIPGVLKKNDRPIPPDGGWARWSYVFTIKPDTQTAGKGTVAGQTLGVMVLSNVRLNAGFLFDDLRITRTP